MKILFVHTWGMGDLVMALPALKKLSNFGDVDLLLSSSGHVTLTDLIGKFGWEIIPPNKKVTFLNLLKIIKLRKKYDLIFFTAGLNPLYITAMVFILSPTFSLGQYYSKRLSLLTHQVAHDPKSSLFLNNLNTLNEYFPLSKEDFLDFPPTLLPEVISSRRFNSLDILIHPGCDEKNAYRRWPSNNFIELINKIIESRGYEFRIGVIFGPSEEPLYQEFFDCFGDNRSVRLFKGLKLSEVFQLIKSSRQVLTTDSGIGHLAALFSVPVTSIFGPADPRKTAPIGVYSKVICPRINLSCMPCVKPGGQYGCSAQTCLKSISVETVFNALETDFDASE